MYRLDDPAHNLHVNTGSLGEVELKYVSVKDTLAIYKIAQEKDSDAEQRVMKILFNQLLKPHVIMDKFSGIPAADKIVLVKAFMAHEKTLFEDYSDTEDLYIDFLAAIIACEKRQLQEFQDAISPAITNAQQQIAKIAQQHNLIQKSIANSLLFQSSGLIAQINSIKVPQLDSLTKSALAMNPITKNLDNITSGLTAAVKVNVDAISRVLSSVDWTKQLREHQSQLAEISRKYGIAAKDSAKILRKYKWFISPNTPAHLIWEIKKLDGKPGRQDKAVNAIFVGYFKQNRWEPVESMAASWKSSRYLKSRYKIISDCVTTMRTADPSVNIANVVLPTLIVQIDGIIDDYLEANGQPHLAYRRRNTHLAANPLPTSLSNDLGNAARDAFIEVLFKNTQDPQGRPVAVTMHFNRHKILHAQFRQYGKDAYLVRAIMLLDILSRLR